MKVEKGNKFFLKTGANKVEISKTRARKLMERQQLRQRTLLVVCNPCWLSGEAKYKDRAHVGAMKAVRKDGAGNTVYEHDDCPMKRDAAASIIKP